MTTNEPNGSDHLLLRSQLVAQVLQDAQRHRSLRDARLPGQVKVHLVEAPVGEAVAKPDGRRERIGAVGSAAGVLSSARTREACTPRHRFERIAPGRDGPPWDRRRPGEPRRLLRLSLRIGRQRPGGRPRRTPVLAGRVLAPRGQRHADAGRRVWPVRAGRRAPRLSQPSRALLGPHSREAGQPIREPRSATGLAEVA